MRKLRFALLGAGFWSRFQLAGWKELDGVECIAIYNRTLAKAESLAQDMGVPAVYDDPAALLDREQVDFVDICTNAETHASLIRLAAERRIPVICQKPMAESLDIAEQMVEVCHRAEVPFYVNENWRWQEPIRALKEVINSGRIGTPFRGRIRMVSGFPVFQNQPFLRELEQFLLVDIGSHIFDVARFLFGEAESVYCHTQKVQTDIHGEDLATAILRMRSGSTVTCEMGYPGAPHEGDSFPQTYAFIEGDRGSVSLSREYWIRVVDRSGEDAWQVIPPHFHWADPAYDVVHSSIVPCQRDLLAGLRSEKIPETTAEDNLQTIRIVHGAYASAMENVVIQLPASRPDRY